MTHPRLKISAAKSYCSPYSTSGAISIEREEDHSMRETDKKDANIHLIVPLKLSVFSKVISWQLPKSKYLKRKMEGINASCKAGEVGIEYQPIWLEQCFLDHDGGGYLLV